ncbi:cellulose binding domain-containing protein [Symbioplanes lichenis]|uniref:cellulose binding domain-containing protein n=1 Tax=Symbioplanes lichenis TaxID=1629072 RepID=UPI002738FB2E|nr:cellulose binding domain-containing protein [Actinoplanes lichenis]
MPRPWRPIHLLLVIGLVLAAAGTAFAGTAAAGTAFAGSATAAGTSGCGQAPTLRNGTYTIQSGGQTRSYILRIPDNYQPTLRYRLFVGLHWLNGSAAAVADGGGAAGAGWAFYGQQRMSGNGAIFIAPQGLDAGWANTGGRDVTLVDDILRTVEGALCVDTTQRFALGWSYGGSMSYALACARPTVFRAVAVYSGANLSGCAGGSQPVAYFGIHGTYDSVLNISLGRSIRDTFVRANGCTAQNPPEPARGSGRHITTAYAGCRAGYPVQWAAFDGDHTPEPVDGGSPNTASTWTTGEVWRFLTQFGPATSPAGDPSTPPSGSPSTPPAPGAACRVTATMNAWNTGPTTSLTVTNTGSAAISGWALGFALPAGQSIVSGWNATYSPAAGQVTARNAGYNGDLAPGASVSIGFQATHTGAAGAPDAYTLNGTSCTTA